MQARELGLKIDIERKRSEYRELISANELDQELQQVPDLRDDKSNPQMAMDTSLNQTPARTSAGRGGK